MLDLLREGEMRPGAQRIADRAGVSLRTVFRHFDDLDALLAVAVAQQLERVAPLFAVEIEPGPLAERIDVVVAHRAGLFEEIAPVRRAALLDEPFHEPVREGLRRSHRRLRRQLERGFAGELGGRPPAARRRLLDALDVAASWSTWDTLRSVQGLSAREARSVLHQLLGSLLEAAAPQASR